MNPNDRHRTLEQHQQQALDSPGSCAPAKDHEKMCGSHIEDGKYTCTRTLYHEGRHAEYSLTCHVILSWNVSEFEEIDRVLEKVGVPRGIFIHGKEHTDRHKNEMPYVSQTLVQRIQTLVDSEKELTQELINTWMDLHWRQRALEAYDNKLTGEDDAEVTELCRLAKMKRAPARIGRGHQMANPEPPNSNYCLVCGSCSAEDVMRPCRGHR